MSENLIQIKGNTQGLLVSAQNNSWNEVKESLLSKIDESPDFYKGARLSLDVGELSVRSIELSKIRDLLSKREITLWAVLSTSETTIQTAQILGLSTDLGQYTKQEKRKNNSDYFEGDSAVWIEKNLRAGYKIETKCHVVVFGDVNPGAEIVSAGSVIVWGRLSGSVHAGADGDLHSKVMALNLEPTSLKIGEISASPFEKKKKKQPEIAKISENAIIIEGWEYKKNRRGDL